MDKFTAEEANLISIYDTPDRAELLSDLKMSLPYVAGEPDIKALMRTVIDKLESMSNVEYAEMMVSPVNKFEYQE